MKKSAIITKAVDDLFEATGLEGVLEFDKETARIYMRGIWRTAFKRGHKKGMRDEQNIAKDEADKTRADFEREV